MLSLGKLKSRFDHYVVASNLSAYLDGELSVRQSLRVERHLAQCAECARDLDTLRETKRLLCCVPTRSVPRSFALPLSVCTEQFKSRRWSVVQSRLRVATLVVTFLLILALSGDALIGVGAIPLRERVPVSGGMFDTVAVKRLATEGEPENASMEPVEATGTAEEAAWAASVADSPEEPMLRAAPRGLRLDETLPDDGDAITAAQESPSSASGTPGPRDELPLNPTRVPPVRSLSAETSDQDGKGGLGGPAAPSDGAPGARVAPDEEVESGYAVAAELGIAGPPAVSDSTEEAALQSEGSERDGAVVTGYGQEPPSGSENALPWETWRAMRLASGVLLGLLVLLLGGLVWAGHKRRV